MHDIPSGLKNVYGNPKEGGDCFFYFIEVHDWNVESVFNLFC